MAIQASPQEIFEIPIYVSRIMFEWYLLLFAPKDGQNVIGGKHFCELQRHCGFQNPCPIVDHQTKLVVDRLHLAALRVRSTPYLITVLHNHNAMIFIWNAALTSEINSHIMSSRVYVILIINNIVVGLLSWSHELFYDSIVHYSPFNIFESTLPCLSRTIIIGRLSLSSCWCAVCSIRMALVSSHSTDALSVKDATFIVTEPSDRQTLTASNASIIETTCRITRSSTFEMFKSWFVVSIRAGFIYGWFVQERYTKWSLWHDSNFLLNDPNYNFWRFPWCTIWNVLYHYVNLDNMDLIVHSWPLVSLRQLGIRLDLF